MQGLHAGEAGRLPQPTQFAGVDLRRPKGYQPPPPPPPPPATEGDPCPRCESRDTKFCYYNNYNTSQPRHFCKGCRRYWTKGGTLRNVPVGGGSRKSSPAAKRSKPSKRRRVAPPELAPPKSDSSPTAAAPTEVSTQGANELAAPAATDGGFKNLELPEPMAGLGLGFLDTDVKASVDPNPFEWPPAFDVSSYWAQNGFADVDPTLFLNLP